MSNRQIFLMPEAFVRNHAKYKKPLPKINYWFEMMVQVQEDKNYDYWDAENIKIDLLKLKEYYERN